MRFRYRGSVLSRLPSEVWHYLIDAPGTYLWLGALLVVGRWLAWMPAERQDAVLAANSTNLVRVRRAAPKVWVTSAFFTAGTRWLFYLVTYSAFHAPVEHWHTDPVFRERVLIEWRKIAPYKAQGFIADWP